MGEEGQRGAPGVGGSKVRWCLVLAVCYCPLLCCIIGRQGAVR